MNQSFGFGHENTNPTEMNLLQGPSKGLVLSHLASLISLSLANTLLSENPTLKMKNFSSTIQTD